ncbi:MAG: rod shape-determining protein RodA [Acidobacteriota bacterium]
MLPDWLKRIDGVLLFTAVTLSLIGVAFIHSAKDRGDGLASEASHQLMVLVIALGVAAGLTWLDYRKLAKIAPILLGGGMALLGGVLLRGREVAGAQAWLDLPGLPRIQPSEFVKVAVVLMLAALASKREPGRLRWHHAALDTIVVGLPVGLILLQNDLGTALTFAPLLLAAMFCSGLSWRVIGVLGVLVALSTPLVWPHLSDYQKDRILLPFQPERDPTGRGYQGIQARIAVGSGGLVGQGYCEGPQNRLGFLPARHTDFVFAVVAEEWGFLGATLVLGLYALLLARLLAAAVAAPDRLGSFVCLGAASLIAAHLVVNVGMVLGLMPIIGIPLPLMSHGGSSLLSTFALLGLVGSVRWRTAA